MPQYVSKLNENLIIDTLHNHIMMASIFSAFVNHKLATFAAAFAVGISSGLAYLGMFKCMKTKEIRVPKFSYFYFEFALPY